MSGKTPTLAGTTVPTIILSTITITRVMEAAAPIVTHITALALLEFPGQMLPDQ